MAKKPKDEFKRGKGGRFGKGNRGGPGNPLGGRVWKMRMKFLDAVEKNDGITKAVDALIGAIPGGDQQLSASQIVAINQILDRAGCSIDAILKERKVDVDEKAVDTLAGLEDRIGEADE